MNLLLACCSYIFEESSYTTPSPAKFESELVEAGVLHEQAEIFASVWQNGAHEYIQACKDNSVLAPRRLIESDWQLVMETADSAGVRLQKGYAMLELRLASDAPAVRARIPPSIAHDGLVVFALQAGGKSIESLNMRLDKQQLQDLLNKLDVIQGQMDKLM